MDERVDAAEGAWRSDWPGRGAQIVLIRDQVPHPRSGLEEWSFHAHLRAATGEEYGLFCAFIRHEAIGVDGELLVTHSLLFSRSDEARRSYSSESWCDSVDAIRSRFTTDGGIDPHIAAAFSQALADGQPIPPDRLMPKPAHAAKEWLELDYGGVGTLRATSEGSYELAVTGEREQFALTLTPTKPAIAHGEDGVVRGRRPDGGDALFTYVVPRLAVRGTVTLPSGIAVQVTGCGWHEHAWGGSWQRPEESVVPDRCWEWAGIQLDNGWDVSGAVLRQVGVAGSPLGAAQTVSVASAPDGRRVVCGLTLSGADPWMSLSTLNTYPTRLDVAVADLELSLTVRALFPEQEFRTMLTGGGHLAAWARVEGVMAGKPVRGRALIRVSPFNRIEDFEGYLHRLQDLAQAEIRLLYPDVPAANCGAELAGIGLSTLGTGVGERLHATLVPPVRHVSDVGGKCCWAYILCAAIEMFGVRCDPYTSLLGLTELQHSATLALDDIEDRSALRRGRPAAHLVHGTAETINAATAAYFVFDPVIRRLAAADRELQLRLYQVYLKGLRGGHAGQGLDIAGHAELMDLAVATGDSEALLRSVRATHRLKTGLHARVCAEVGALFAGADEAQLTAVGDYFEAVGIAFQITDDIMDLRGVTGRGAQGVRRPTKHACEDLRAGKVTMPLAHAVGLLPGEQMAALWRSIRGGCADTDTVREAARTLADCGAVDACYAEAKALVEQSWPKLESLPNSHHKVISRALGLYSALRGNDLTTSPTTIRSAR